MTEDKIEKGAALLLEKYNAEDKMDISEEGSEIHITDSTNSREIGRYSPQRRMKLEEALTLSQIVKNLSACSSSRTANSKCNILLENVLDDIRTESLVKTMHWSEEEKKFLTALSQLDQDIEETSSMIKSKKGCKGGRKK